MGKWLCNHEDPGSVLQNSFKSQACQHISKLGAACRDGCSLELSGQAAEPKCKVLHSIRDLISKDRIQREIEEDIPN